MNDTTLVIVFCILIILLTSVIGSSNIESSVFRIENVKKQAFENYVDDEIVEDLQRMDENSITLRGQDGERIVLRGPQMISPDAYDSTRLKDVVQGPIMSDRINYFRIGLANFFTRHDYVSRKTKLEFDDYIKDKVYIWPSYQDICCQSLDTGTTDLDCACDNINISNSSCLDNLMKFHNESRVSTIEGNIGAPKTSNCTMTILGNDYMLMKRSLKMKIKEIKQVDIGRNKRFRLNLSGQLALFALSRPMFLSFNTSGLYRVIHEDKNNPSTENEYEIAKFSNMFANFDSTRTRDNIVYLQQVAHDEIEGLRVFEETNTHIARTQDIAKKDHPVTLYYLNYRSEVKVYDAQTHVINLFLNHKIYNSFSLANTIDILTGNDKSQLVRFVRLHKSQSGILDLIIDDIRYPLPEDFIYYDPKQYQRFDICITVSYDIVLIACYCIDSITRKNISYLSRYNLPRSFGMKKETVMEIIKGQSPDMFYMMRNNLKDVMSLTAIPNYAHLAYSLGYVFNIS